MLTRSARTRLEPENHALAVKLENDNAVLEELPVQLASPSKIVARASRERKFRKDGETVVVASKYFAQTELALTPKQAAPKLSKPRLVKPLTRPISSTKFGLIQEELQDDLFALLVQAILWNQTHGRAARPVLNTILRLYPTPERLANASLVDLTALIQPIGMHNRRAKRLIDLSNTWLAAPPCKTRRYRKIGYPNKRSGRDVKPGEVLAENDLREGWEIAHLPGIGAYALDSYRIFHRDKLREVPADEEPEWKRVTAGDKELRAWLVWRWSIEGFVYDVKTGRTAPLAG